MKLYLSNRQKGWLGLLTFSYCFMLSAFGGATDRMSEYHEKTGSWAILWFYLIFGASIALVFFCIAFVQGLMKKP